MENWTEEEEKARKTVMEAAQKNIFHCTDETPYDPQTTPDGMVMHMTVDHFENGDVVCVHCHYVLAGPNQNI